MLRHTKLKIGTQESSLVLEGHWGDTRVGIHPLNPSLVVCLCLTRYSLYADSKEFILR